MRWRERRWQHLTYAHTKGRTRRHQKQSFRTGDKSRAGASCHHFNLASPHLFWGTQAAFILAEKRLRRLSALRHVNQRATRTVTLRPVVLGLQYSTILVLDTRLLLLQPNPRNWRWALRSFSWALAWVGETMAGWLGALSFKDSNEAQSLRNLCGRPRMPCLRCDACCFDVRASAGERP
jgi:hypothetical protein